jgi:hypothetical protein
LIPALQHMDNFSQVAVCRSSATNLNKNSPSTHVELDFDMLGVVRKLVKHVIYLFKTKN